MVLLSGFPLVLWSGVQARTPMMAGKKGKTGVPETSFSSKWPVLLERIPTSKSQQQFPYFYIC